MLVKLHFKQIDYGYMDGLVWNLPGRRVLFTVADTCNGCVHQFAQPVGRVMYQILIPDAQHRQLPTRLVAAQVLLQRQLVVNQMIIVLRDLLGPSSMGAFVGANCFM